MMSEENKSQCTMKYKLLAFLPAVVGFNETTKLINESRKLRPFLIVADVRPSGLSWLYLSH